MLGLLPLYFIGKYYAELATAYNRKGWVFALIGVLIALASQFLLGLIVGFIAVMQNNESLLESELLLNLGAIMFSILVAVVVYKILESNWKKNPKTTPGREDLLDDQGE